MGASCWSLVFHTGSFEKNLANINLRISIKILNLKNLRQRILSIFAVPVVILNSGVAMKTVRNVVLDSK